MKIENKLLYFVALSLLVGACTVNKIPIPTGGSRADAIIELSYDVGMFEKPVVDWVAAKSSAAQRCRAWGYSQAEAFGGQKSQCHAYNAYGNCLRATITLNYQCIGSP